MRVNRRSTRANDSCATFLYRCSKLLAQIAGKALFGTGLSAIAAVSATALPVWYGLDPTGNETDVTWKRLESKRFSVYYDERANPLANHTLSALETAYPHISALLGVELKSKPATENPKTVMSRFERVPVVLSTQAEWGGFANFATQNIELKVRDGAQAAGIQHELVHRLMYEHFDPLLGPAGRAVSLLMVPTWWIEGVPEYFTESMGRLESAGAARHLAQNQTHISWDRLHAMLPPDEYGFRGYVTSGRLIKYLFESRSDVDIATIHNKFFHKTITPPFVNAGDAIIETYWKKDGREMYEDFKKSETDYWNRYTDGLPRLPKTGKTFLSARGAWPTVISPKGIYWSELRKDTHDGALFFSDLNGKHTRLPLSLDGSAAFDIHPKEIDGGGFWTTKVDQFQNGLVAEQLVHVKFSGQLHEINDERVQSVDTLQVSSSDAPITVTQVYARGSGRAFFIGITRGQYAFYNADMNTKHVTKLAEFKVPEMATFAHKQFNVDRDNNCVSLLIDADLERTRLEKICSNGNREVVFTEGQAYIKDAAEMSDGSYILLAGWNDLYSAVRLKNGTIAPIAVFPNFVRGIQPWANEDSVAMWDFDDLDFNLVKVPLSALQEKYMEWAKGKDEASPWKKFPAWKAYEPPFQRYTAARKLTVATGTKTQSENVSDTKADYRTSHFFSYPLLLPPPFGNWNVGLVSVPLQDEIERYRVLIFGYYNFYSNALSGTVTYQNNRVLDGSAAALYSRERFNGYYDINAVSGVNYLRENGVSASAVKRFHDSHFSVSTFAEGKKVTPLYDSEFKTPHESLGVQNANVFGGGLGLGIHLFDHAYYVGEAKKPNQEHLVWTADLSTGYRKYNSLGRTLNGAGAEISALDYYQVDAGLSTSVSYRSKVLTLRSEGAGTLGRNAFFLRESYQPYRTFMPGTDSSFNAVNFPILGRGEIFGLSQGTWSFRNSADFSFPILEDIDQKFYVLYFDSLRGEVVFSRGGVAKKENFEGAKVLNSASFATRIEIDVKGLKLYPLLAVGKVFGRQGVTLFGQIATSQFF